MRFLSFLVELILAIFGVDYYELKMQQYKRRGRR